MYSGRAPGFEPQKIARRRISLTRAAVYAAPAASGIKLKAGIDRPHTLAAGTYYINAVAG